MTRRNWAFDITVAVVVGVLGQLEAWWGFASTHRQGPLWAQSLLYAVTAALLVGRRVHPLACQAAILAVSVVEFLAVGAPEGNAVVLPTLVAGYTVGRRLEPRRAWWGLVLAGLFWLAWSSLDPTGAHANVRERLLTLVWLAPSVIAWLLGALVRVTALNTEQRRVNREQRASQAVSDERNRIARELHDVIGHSVSVMTVQASSRPRSGRRCKRSRQCDGRRSRRCDEWSGCSARPVTRPTSNRRRGSSSSTGWPTSSAPPVCP